MTVNSPFSGRVVEVAVGMGECVGAGDSTGEAVGVGLVTSFESTEVVAPATAMATKTIIVIILLIEFQKLQ